MKLNIKESVNFSINISEFFDLTKDEIEQELNRLPVGTVITGVCDASGRYDFDTHIEKKSGKKSNYFTPMGSPNDWKVQSTWWEIGGSEQPYIVRTIFEIINDKNKYYRVSGANLPVINGYMVHSQMTDMCFVAVHEDSEVLKSNEIDIETWIMQGYETEEQGQELYNKLTSKGIKFGWDEYNDNDTWHDLVNDPEIVKCARTPHEAWAINMSFDTQRPIWYRINLIGEYSTRF